VTPRNSSRKVRVTSYWRDKEVLVTGADGFIGSHLTERLSKEGARVRAFVYYNSFGRLGWLDETVPDLMENIEVFPGDIRDPNRVLEAVENQQIVFHLASLIAIPYSYHAPDSYVQTNVGGTLNVLNACRLAEVEGVVHTSTSEVYGTAQYVPIDEKHPLQGQSPYSATKIGADMLAESFHRSFDLPVSIIRPFNTYGPRQSARAVIPTILSQLFQERKQIKLGALHPTRDFNFVDDTVSGFLAMAEADGTKGRVVNVGSGRETSIGDVVEMLVRITGKKAEVLCEEERIRPQESEVDRLLCDASLARELTDWQPLHSLEEGLEITARWVRDNLHTFRTDRYSI
jgi:dTDP-glucose 4,6-dehydratase